MKLVTRITFTDDNGNKFFGEGPMRFLGAVERTGSLRAAAAEMEMAYSKASKLLKQAEQNLGFSLTARSAGGKDGGGSVLTPEGKRWLSRYEAYRSACIQANESLLRQYFPKIGCIIMASGQGKRFGSNKLMADFCGNPMITRALDATQGLFLRRVVVTRHRDVADLCRERNAEVILHDAPDRNDTIRLGLEAMGDVDACLFLPGDQPLLRKETVGMIVDSWRDHQQMILRPVCGNTVGSPVLFPSWAFSELQSLPTGKGGSFVIRSHPEKVMQVIVSDPSELMDADTPETLELLKGLIHD